jgi:flagellar basal body-associated protein FliL
MPEKKKVLGTVDARQGSRRLTNLRVLIVSLLLAILVGFVFYVRWSGSTGVDKPSEPAPATEQR